MLEEISKHLGDNALSLAIAFLLFIIIYDDKAIDRIKDKKLKPFIYCTLGAYLLQLILTIIIGLTP